MKVAAIDCGTNSIRLLIASLDEQGQLVEHDRRTTMARLGQGIDATGEFHPDALARTFAAVDEYAAVIADSSVDRIGFFATSAARDARNRSVFTEGIKQRLGVEPEIIAGELEARLSAAGACLNLPNAVDPVLVMDIGGGSTELIRTSAGQIESAQSIDMGAVRIRERYLLGDPPTASEIERAHTQINALLDGCTVSLEGIGTFVGVAGTATSMAATDLGLETYDRTKVHHHVISQDAIQSLALRWAHLSVDELRAEPAMHPVRAEVISGGALILAAVAQRVGRDMIISESDILDGIAISLLTDS